MVRLDLVIAAKVTPTVGDRHSTLRASSVELDILSTVRHVEAVTRAAVDCFTLEESSQFDPLDKDWNFCLLGKKLPPCSNSNFKSSNVHTWSKLGIGFDLALGRVVRKFLR
jgi:hypothetical protein